MPAGTWLASIPAISMLPPKPPSSSPTACSIVDLPEPEGPSSATISPGLIVRFTPRSTSIVTPPCSKLRVRFVRRTTGCTGALLIAQHLDRIRARRLARRIERSKEAHPQRQQTDRGHFRGIGAARQVGEET